MTASVAMLVRQIRHEFATLVRMPITLILSVGFPLLFFVILATMIGKDTVDPGSGTRIVQLIAPGLASFGVVMATFSFLAAAFTEARASGVIKRLAGTPAPGWVLIGGRVGAATVLGLVAVVLVFGVGWAAYDLELPGRAAGAVVVALALAAACFSSWGLVIAHLLRSPATTIAVTNGLAIPLSFVSDVFFFGGAALPGWLNRVGTVFPLKHVARILADGLDPRGTGNGFQAEPFAILGAWTLVGVALAAWRLRRGETAGRARRSPALVSGADRLPLRSGSPSQMALLGGQFRHALAILWRDPSFVFFAMVFPVVLAVLIPTVNGGGDQILPSGQVFGSFYAATMAIYGAAVTAYVNLPGALAEDRGRGVLKRMRAAPLPTWTMLAGRVLGALVLALLTLGIIAVASGVAFRLSLPPAWPVSLLVFVVATLCFAVLGLAIASIARSAQAAIGLALGTLLPLAFISEIFVIGAPMPRPLDLIAGSFPLRHAARALTATTLPDAGMWAVPWGHLAVLVAWGVTGAVVVARRFSWEAAEPSRQKGVPAPRS